MESALKAGSLVLVWKTSKIKKGDIIAFRHNGKILIKRVIEVAGRRLTVLGDNPTDSLDSRDFGSIDLADIIGKVIYT